MAMGDKQTCVRTMARKLHLQFAHPTAENLKKLINKAGFKNRKLIKEIDNVSKTCIICLKHKKAPPDQLIVSHWPLDSTK